MFWNGYVSKGKNELQWVEVVSKKVTRPTRGESHICLTDIPFFDSHSPYFFIKNGLKLLKEKSLETRKFYIRRNNNKVNSIETERIFIADLLPRSDLEK